MLGFKERCYYLTKKKIEEIKIEPQDIIIESKAINLVARNGATSKKKKRKKNKK